MSVLHMRRCWKVSRLVARMHHNRLLCQNDGDLGLCLSYPNVPSHLRLSRMENLLLAWCVCRFLGAPGDDVNVKLRQGYL